MSLLAAVAEFERDLLIDRTRSGLARARADVTLGRPRSIAAGAIGEVRSRLAAGETISAIAKAYRTSRQTIMRNKNATVEG